MAVDAGPQPRLPGGFQGRGQDGVTGPPDGEVPGQEILPAVTGLKGGDEARRRCGLAHAQDIAHLLGVGAELEVAEADVGMQDISPLDDAVLTAGRAIRPAGDAATLQVHVREEPGRQAQALEAAADVPGDVLCPGDARGNDPLTEGFGDDAPGDGDNLGIDLGLHGRAGLEPADDQGFGRGQPLGIVGGQDLQEPVPQGGGQAVRDGPFPRDVDPDAPGVPADDDLGQGLPLGVEVASGPGGRIGPAQRVPVD